MEPADSRHGGRQASLRCCASLKQLIVRGDDRPEPIPVVSQTVSRVPAPAAEPTPLSQKRAQNFHPSRDRQTLNHHVRDSFSPPFWIASMSKSLLDELALPESLGQSGPASHVGP